jgi:DNA-binding response OmpR family regulator
MTAILRRKPRTHLQPLLLVSSEGTLAEEVIRHLRLLGEIAVWIDTYNAADEMMQVVDFGLIVVHVATPCDWSMCRRIAHATRCPVGIITHLLAHDRRYRDRAFSMGVAAYIARPVSRARLRELLRRVRAGDTSIELIKGAPYSVS